MNKNKRGGVMKVIVTNPLTEEQKEQIYKNIYEYYRREGERRNEKDENS